MEYRCPGSGNYGTPTLEIRRCPECGNEIELFSTDAKAVCPVCGFVAFNDRQSCIQWCEHARECVGSDVYDRLVRPK